MRNVSFERKTFEVFIPKEEIDSIVQSLADQLNEKYIGSNKEVILVSILDGSFIFMADLIRKLKFDHSVEFVKIKSYEGTESSGEVDYILKLKANINDKVVIVLEDIIDTGLTIESFMDELKQKSPAILEICTLLSKPDVHNDIIPIDYIGKEIPPSFVIGYGLDINGKGRHLADIYHLVSD